jgi:hypothetical protein
MRWKAKMNNDEVVVGFLWRERDEVDVQSLVTPLVPTYFRWLVACRGSEKCQTALLFSPTCLQPITDVSHPWVAAPRRVIDQRTNAIMNLNAHTTVVLRCPSTT